MKSGKKIISTLLFLACILSGILLAFTPPYIPNKITTEAELDSLIHLSLNDANIASSQIRTSNVRIDSSFTRKIYRVKVHPSFSKTGFHIQLHKRFFSLGLATPSRVVFPEQDMNIYVVNKETIFRSIRLISDASLVIPEPKIEVEN